MNYFKIGDIVTLKTHPLLTKKPLLIKDFPGLVPPLMLVKEILFAEKSKKRLFSENIKDAKVSDLVKYSCVYFDSNKSQFNDKIIYQSMLAPYSDLKFYKYSKAKSKKSEISLLDEVENYKLAQYEFGKVVQFKTKKLEYRKSYIQGNNEIIKNSFQTPNFILSGLKLPEDEELFYENGKPKKIIPNTLYKVMWFNHFQQKFSEQYLPNEFFVEDLVID